LEPLSAQATRPGQVLAVEATFGRERRRLLDFLRRRVGDRGDAEDLLQEVFSQLLSTDSLTEPIENLTAWLFSVARNKVIDWYRARRLAREGARERDDLRSDPADGPDHAYWRSVFWSELADALDDLPEEQRDVFVAHQLEGLSFKEIAARTGEPINTLLSRKHYAVLFLRERLRDLYDVLESR
jgi:RNA polymerase sigma factor (sigma-70 family)